MAGNIPTTNIYNVPGAGYSVQDMVGQPRGNLQNLKPCMHGGGASPLPSSKPAAIRKPAPVLAADLLARMAGKALPARHTGHTSCKVLNSDLFLFMGGQQFFRQSVNDFRFQHIDDAGFQKMPVGHNAYFPGRLRGFKRVNMSELFF